jgi:FkbM family methyltransferase
MTNRILRRLAARLPARWQGELKRLHYRRRIRQGTFVSDEPEFPLLSRFAAPGDWVVDVGANVGFYTKRLAELVAPDGRVLAFEPVPETFVLLANNLESCSISNVTLFNVAVSETAGMAAMSIPRFDDSGLKNFYQARLLAEGESDLTVLTVSLDSLRIPKTIKLVKIDAEGHELSVLKGMRDTLARDRPVLIVEMPSQEAIALLASLGYAGTRIAESPNVVFNQSNVDAPRFLA